MKQIFFLTKACHSFLVICCLFSMSEKVMGQSTDQPQRVVLSARSIELQDFISDMELDFPTLTEQQRSVQFESLVSKLRFEYETQSRTSSNEQQGITSVNGPYLSIVEYPVCSGQFHQNIRAIRLALASTQAQYNLEQIDFNTNEFYLNFKSISTSEDKINRLNLAKQSGLLAGKMGPFILADSPLGLGAFIGQNVSDNINDGMSLADLDLAQETLEEAADYLMIWKGHTHYSESELEIATKTWIQLLEIGLYKNDQRFLDEVIFKLRNWIVEYPQALAFFTDKWSEIFRSNTLVSMISGALGKLIQGPRIQLDQSFQCGCEDEAAKLNMTKPNRLHLFYLDTSITNHNLLNQWALVTLEFDRDREKFQAIKQIHPGFENPLEQIFLDLLDQSDIETQLLGVRILEYINDEEKRSYLDKTRSHLIEIFETSRNPVFQRKALLELRKLKDFGLLDVYERYLGHAKTDDLVFAEIINNLSDYNDPRAISILVNSTRKFETIIDEVNRLVELNAGAEIKFSYLQAFEKLNNNALTAIENLLNHQNGQRRNSWGPENAIALLDMIKTPESTDVLFRAFKSENMHVLYALHHVLKDRGQDDTENRLIAVINGAKFNRYAKQIAIQTLEYYESDQVRDFLLNILKDDTVNLFRREAAMVLGGFSQHKDEIVNGLLDVLNHGNPNEWSVLHEYTLISLGKLNDPRAIDTLVEWIYSVSNENRSAAMYALRRFKKEAVSSLIAHLNEKGQNVGVEIITLLSEADDVRAIEPLIKLFQSNQLPAELTQAVNSALQHLLRTR